MKKVLFAIIVSCLFVNLAWADEASTETKPVLNKIVVVKLDGEITETPPGIDLGLPDLQLNIFWDQLRLIRMVKEDKTVKALVLLVNSPKLSLAQCQQIAMELHKLRASGKKVFVHSDSIPTSLFIMALPADVVSMSPGSMLEINGLSAHLFYYKSLMEKLGIDVEVIHLGKFKLFAEPYTATQPSEYMNTQINDLLDNLYAQIIDTIAKYRKITSQKAKDILDQGPFVAEQAKDFGLIDKVIHRDDLLKQIQKQLDGRLTYNYGKTQPQQFKSGFGGLLQIFSMIGSKAGEAAAQDKIAVVYVSGMVVEGQNEQLFGPTETAGSETMRKAFKSIQKDDKIKAVVVRVDSPGGSSSASEIIWKLIHDTGKTKPVVASMGTVAGSGGYYIASAANYIFASPATMTGSIGVISGKPVLKKLLDKIYLNQYTYSRGKNANIYDPFAALSESQRKSMEEQMQLIFKTFKDRVMEGRKDKIKDIDALATGRVYTGEQGISLGLVDKIGSLADAVTLASEKAKIKTYKVVNYPEPRSIPEILLESMGYKLDPEGMTGETKILSALANNLAELPGLNPKLIRKAMSIAKMMQKGNILAISPYEIELR